METKKETSPLPAITAWVLESYKKNPPLEGHRKFNVHIYDTAEKAEAVQTLTARGFSCTLSNNDNSLEVTKN